MEKSQRTQWNLLRYSLEDEPWKQSNQIVTKAIKNLEVSYKLHQSVKTARIKEFFPIDHHHTTTDPTVLGSPPPFTVEELKSAVRKIEERSPALTAFFRKP
ncbi:hypothetical protein JTB14_014698 [Gonioctena quinquepunctata]|nr:hypothetical protein JTB14_014698 [Gonioctena quinquepunctata]